MGVSAKVVVALLLTFAAGCVDIIGYLTLYHTFTAHMTGLTVHLGESVVESRWHDGAVLAVVLLAFLLGSVVGRTMLEIGARYGVRSAATPALLLETALILMVAFTAQAHVNLMTVFMLAGAMGMQTATLTRVGSLTVHTTFVTGMLNKLAQLVSQEAFLAYDRFRGHDDRTRRSKLNRQAVFIFGIWCLYLIGAIAGGWMQSEWGARSLLIPACVVAGVAIIDQVNPLAIEEELDQAQR